MGGEKDEAAQCSDDMCQADAGEGDNVSGFSSPVLLVSNEWRHLEIRLEHELEDEDVNDKLYLLYCNGS